MLGPKSLNHLKLQTATTKSEVSNTKQHYQEYFSSRDYNIIRYMDINTYLFLDWIFKD